MLGVDDGRIHVGENLELVGHAQIVAIGRQSVRNHALAHLLLGERIDHVVFLGHLADPAVTFQHETPWENLVIG